MRDNENEFEREEVTAPLSAPTPEEIAFWERVRARTRDLRQQAAQALAAAVP